MELISADFFKTVVTDVLPIMQAHGVFAG